MIISVILAYSRATMRVHIIDSYGQVSGVVVVLSLARDGYRRKIESTTQMYLHHARGVLAYTQDTRSSRLLGYTHTTVTSGTAIQPSFVFYCGTIITYIMDPVLFLV